MSAIARYFKAKGFDVAGYDRTSTVLTRELEAEGITINYVDEVEAIPTLFIAPSTLVVYTPAIPVDNKQYQYFLTNGFKMMKRAAILGEITRLERGLCIAGTHGKTTTSSMAAHLIYNSHVGATAFLGGISQNYGTNLLLTDKSDYVVIEADEFDRSFLQLTPDVAVITSANARIFKKISFKEEAASFGFYRTAEVNRVFKRHRAEIGINNALSVVQMLEVALVYAKGIGRTLGIKSKNLIIYCNHYGLRYLFKIFLQ